MPPHPPAMAAWGGIAAGEDQGVTRPLGTMQTRPTPASTGACWMMPITWSSPALPGAGRLLGAWWLLGAAGVAAGFTNVLLAACGGWGSVANLGLCGNWQGVERSAFYFRGVRLAGRASSCFDWTFACTHLVGPTPVARPVEPLSAMGRSADLHSALRLRLREGLAITCLQASEVYGSLGRNLSAFCAMPQDALCCGICLGDCDINELVGQSAQTKDALERSLAIFTLPGWQSDMGINTWTDFNRIHFEAWMYMLQHCCPDGQKEL